MKTKAKMTMITFAALYIASLSAVASSSYVTSPIYESAPDTVPVQPRTLPYDEIIGGDDVPPLPPGSVTKPLPDEPTTLPDPEIDDGTKGACIGISGWCVGISW